jgi:hypothetical protein
MEPQLCDTQSIFNRLDRLERQNRRLRSGLAVLAIFAGCWILTAARFGRGGHTVTARQVVLKDEFGTTRAILGMRSAGPGLTLYDENGENVEALLTVLQTGPVLSFYDGKGTSRALLGVTPKGATIAFNDQQGKLRAEMGFLSNAPNVTFFDPNGKPIYLAH